MEDEDQYFDDNEIGHLPADHVSLTHSSNPYVFSP